MASSDSGSGEQGGQGEQGWFDSVVDSVEDALGVGQPEVAPGAVWEAQCGACGHLGHATTQEEANNYVRTHAEIHAGVVLYHG